CPVSQFVTITGGVDYRKSNTGQSYSSYSFFGPYKSELGKDSLKQNQLGLYAGAVFNSKTGFNAEAGGRYNHHSTYGSNFVFNVNPSFLLNDQWKIFVNVSSGYKTPSLYQLFSEYGNKGLDPEKALSFEGGLQFFAKENKAMARATYFNRTVKDVIAFFTDPNTYQSMYINQDEQKDHGVELETTVAISKKLSFKLFYTWIDGHITTKVNGKDTTYFNLIRRPKSSVGASLGGNVTKKLYLSTSLNANSEATDITYDAFFNQVEVKLKAYSLWNFYGQYALLKNRLKIFADLRNITNTKYTEVYGFNTMGFNATGGIRFNF
ncbi:MAG TPA: TonB-dependent receptor, partial [Ferruginibacter sp.]|nr:TonB-dependent receptor [Ferruginibacter sp.]